MSSRDCKAGGDLVIAIGASTSDVSSILSIGNGLASAVLDLLDSRLSAVASTEALTSEGIGLLNAAALALIEVDHAKLGKSCGRVDG